MFCGVHRAYSQSRVYTIRRTSAKRGFRHLFPLLIRISLGLAYANGKLGAILGTIGGSVHDETQIVGIGGETFPIEPALALCTLNKPGMHLQDVNQCSLGLKSGINCQH